MILSATPESVIGIDPGREKCGVAIVHKRNGLQYVAVIPTPELATAVGELSKRYQTNSIVLGNGTSHREAKTAIESTGIYRIYVIDEAHTTEQARNRFWQENPPKGLRRLIPLGLQTPPEPVDGYVAAILAERWLAGEK